MTMRLISAKAAKVESTIGNGARAPSLAAIMRDGTQMTCLSSGTSELPVSVIPKPCGR